MVVEIKKKPANDPPLPPTEDKDEKKKKKPRKKKPKDPKESQIEKPASQMGLNVVIMKRTSS
jgi:hypothetical protein